MATDATSSAFDLILQPLAAQLPVEVAASVASFELSAEVQERLHRFAEKSTAGTLTTAEREEYSSLVTALDFVAIFQAQARRRAARST
jgi:hypothetical protein